MKKVWLFGIPVMIGLALFTQSFVAGRPGTVVGPVTPEVNYEFSGGAGHYDYAPSVIQDQYGVRFAFLCENKDA